jgi:hypothetical protein
MMKFENVAEVGDTIKAYDFKPMDDRPDYFLVGKVTAKGKTRLGFDGYTVTVTESPEHDVRVGLEMFVPFGIVFDDWDGRVSKVA